MTIKFTEDHRCLPSSAKVTGTYCSIVASQLKWAASSPSAVLQSVGLQTFHWESLSTWAELQISLFFVHSMTAHLVCSSLSSLRLANWFTCKIASSWPAPSVTCVPTQYVLGQFSWIESKIRVAVSECVWSDQASQCWERPRDNRIFGLTMTTDKSNAINGVDEFPQCMWPKDSKVDEKIRVPLHISYSTSMHYIHHSRFMPWST